MKREQVGGFENLALDLYQVREPFSLQVFGEVLGATHGY